MRFRLWPAVALTAAAVLATAACRHHAWDGRSDLVVLNGSSCEVTVFVDGWEATTIRVGETETVDNIGAGRHVLEAKDASDRLLERRYVDLQGGEDFYWRLTSCTPH